MRYLKAIAVLGLAVSGFAQPAAATVIAGSCTTVPLSATELNNTMSCSNFNNIGGTLTLNSVTLTINGHIEGTISITNNSSSSANVSGKTTSDFTVGPLSGFTFPSPLMTLAFSSGVQSVAGSGGTYTSGLLAADGSSGALVNTTNLAGYQSVDGTGSWLITVNTLTGLLVTGGGGGINVTQSTSGSANATLSFDYGPTPPQVPEPASMALLGTGLLGLGAMLRRRRRN